MAAEQQQGFNVFDAHIQRFCQRDQQQVNAGPLKNRMHVLYIESHRARLAWLGGPVMVLPRTVPVLVMVVVTDAELQSLRPSVYVLQVACIRYKRVQCDKVNMQISTWYASITPSIATYRVAHAENVFAMVAASVFANSCRGYACRPSPAARSLLHRLHLWSRRLWQPL